MKLRIGFVLPLFLGILSLGFSQDDEGSIPDFEMVFGPRVGVAYAAMSDKEFTEQVNRIFPGGNYSPLQTVFGVNFEQRILLGTTRNQFAFQENLYITGLEQSLFIPSASFLIGYRDSSGFEFGFGPILSINGVSVLGGVGYTFRFSGIYIPVDLSARIPSTKNPPVFSLTTGFNFIFEKH